MFLDEHRLERVLQAYDPKYELSSINYIRWQWGDLKAEKKFAVKAFYASVRPTEDGI